MIATKEQRDNRKKQTAEVWTPHTLVNEMLDKLPKEIWEEGKTFCDPAAGNGNMLINVLYRKIAVHGHDPLEALKTVFGVDIMKDNIRECRIRFLKMISMFGEEITEEHLNVVFTNLVWLNRKKYPKGSLEYDFSFKAKHNQKDIERWMDWIEDGLLEEVNLPVISETISGKARDIFETEADYTDDLCS